MSIFNIDWQGVFWMLWENIKRKSQQRKAERSATMPY